MVTIYSWYASGSQQTSWLQARASRLVGSTRTGRNKLNRPWLWRAWRLALGSNALPGAIVMRWIAWRLARLGAVAAGCRGVLGAGLALVSEGASPRT